MVLLTEFPFLIPGSFKMRENHQMSSFWKRLENSLECWRGVQRKLLSPDFWLDHSLDWKESWMLGGGLCLCPHDPIPAHLVNVFKPSPTSPHTKCYRFVYEPGLGSWAPFGRWVHLSPFSVAVFPLAMSHQFKTCPSF